MAGQGVAWWGGLAFRGWATLVSMGHRHLFRFRIAKGEVACVRCGLPECEAGGERVSQRPVDERSEAERLELARRVFKSWVKP